MFCAQTSKLMMLHAHPWAAKSHFVTERTPVPPAGTLKGASPLVTLLLLQLGYLRGFLLSLFLTV